VHQHVLIIDRKDHDIMIGFDWPPHAGLMPKVPHFHRADPYRANVQGCLQAGQCGIGVAACGDL
jgi:hypothetical protein